MNETVIPIEAELTLFRSQLAALQRRRDRRYRCGLATTSKLHCTDSGKILGAWVFNLSRSGVGLEMAQPLDPGQQVEIHLKTTNNDTPVKLAGHVIHATPVANGAWRVGCRFAEKLSADALESLL